MGRLRNAVIGALGTLCVAGAGYTKWRLDTRGESRGLPADVEIEAEDLRERALANGLDPTRLAYDVVAIKRLEQVLASADPVQAATELLDGKFSRESQKDALGTSTRSWRAAGASLGCGFTVAFYSGKTLGWVASCGGEKETWSAALPEYERHVVKLTVRGDRLQAEGTFPDVVERADAERARLLGKVKSTEVPFALRQAYETLTSRFAPLVFARSCGKGDGETPGGAAIKALADAQRLDLIRQVLRGPNEGGRLLAAEELILQGAANEADSQTIAQLRLLTPVVESCSGCSRGPSEVGPLLDQAETIRTQRVSRKAP
ncbi:MAG: hypothetical protein HS104_03190 [Polyangiaceae bacterium]|nr:hypothetical protein [Polyangiaceae bacterium]